MLGQFVLVRLPDPVALGSEPDSETGLAGMRTLLLLVLGCAVQGPSKESVIDDIKKLPLATQHDIVNCIQQVKCVEMPRVYDVVLDAIDMRCERPLFPSAPKKERKKYEKVLCLLPVLFLFIDQTTSHHLRC